MDEQLDELKESVEGLNKRLDALSRIQEERQAEESSRCVPIASMPLCLVVLTRLRRHDELARILQRVVEIGLRGGWAEFEGTPLPIPRIDLRHGQSTPSNASGSSDTPSSSQSPPPSAP